MPKFKLAKKVAKLDDVAEAYRSAYTERDGEFHLDLDKLEAVEFDDRAEVAGALERERAERKAAKEALEKFKDIDPEKYRDAMQKLDEIDNKKLRDKGEFDRLMEKRQGEWNTEKERYESQVKDLSSRLRTHTLTNKVKEAALRNGVIAEDIDDVLAITANRFDLDDKERIVVRDAEGDSTTLTLDNFFGDLFKTQKPKFYQASGAAGSGAPAGGAGGGSGGAKTVKRSDFDKLSPSEQSTVALSGAQIVD